MSDPIKTILIVLGLAGVYPDVLINNITVAKKKEAIVANFTLENLVNPSIRDIIQSGAVVFFSFEIKTRVNSVAVFQTNIYFSISNKQNMFFLGNSKPLTFDALTNKLFRQEMVVLPGYKKYGKSAGTAQILLSIYAENIPNISDLWGNQPRMELNFQLKE